MAGVNEQAQWEGSRHLDFQILTTGMVVCYVLLCVSELPHSYLPLSHDSLAVRFPPAILQQELCHPITHFSSTQLLSWLKVEGVKDYQGQIGTLGSVFSACHVVKISPSDRTEKLDDTYD